MMLLDRIAITASRQCDLQKGRLILVGVSGGADSLCLLDALWRLGFPMVVAHFNHQIRSEAADDARRVEEAAHTRDADFVLGTENVPEYADANRLSIEEAARNLRYQFLFQQARLFSAQAVVVGHTADDQIETVVMHLLRGAGLNGLKGMVFLNRQHAWDGEIPLARPLLSTWRLETQAYCDEMNLQPVVDSTNTDPTYLRNRVRGELIPLLETYNPRIREALYRSADIMAADYQALEQVIEGMWDDCVSEVGLGYVALERQKILVLNPGIQRGIIRKAVEKLRPAKNDFDLEMVDRALQFIENPVQTRKIELAAGLRLMQEGGLIYLLNGISTPSMGHWPQLEDPAILILEAPGRIIMANGWTLEASLIPENAGNASSIQNNSAVLTNTDLFQVWVDAEKASFPLTIRSRRAGDRWQPLGFEKGSQTLADFFINMKCPVRARDHWPVVCSGDDIVWIPGYRLAHPFRITASTHQLLYLRVTRA